MARPVPPTINATVKADAKGSTYVDVRKMQIAPLKTTEISV